jgi:hypothetical protein
MKRLLPILALAGALWLPVSAQAEFGIEELRAESLNQDGTPNLRAGAHPYEFEVGLQMNLDEEGIPEGTLRELIVDLPAGMVGNPLAVPRCTGAQFEGQVPHCPGNTQIGIAEVEVVGFEEPLKTPVYNLTPPLGVPASVGFSIVNENSFQEASLRQSDFGVRVSDITLPTRVAVQSVTETIWGVPAEESHDEERFCFTPEGNQFVGCPSHVEPPEAFLTLPSACGAPLELTATVASVQEPEVPRSASAQFPGDGGVPEGLNGCDKPPFKPTISSQPETGAADSPTGLAFGLKVPQTPLPADGDPDGEATATAHLRDAVVTLPAGLAVNPSGAIGRAGCSPAQIGLGSDGAPQCPDNSKIGEVTVQTPLLDHPAPGSVYLASQLANPFNSLLAIYIVIDDPQSGVIVKLAGEVQPDPLTGRLRTVVTQNPQLPFSDFSFDFFGGPRATLTTPQLCGTYTTTTQLTPWSAPEGADASPASAFPIAAGPNGGPCAPTEAQLPNSPSLQAGTTLPLAASYSPFVLQLSRENGSQRLGAVSATLPPGLTGKLAGVERCTEAQLALAASRNEPGEGALEQASPSCPAASRVGTVTVGAGSGAPLHVQGTAYLAGPYKGAPLSLAIITPAVAGPFDLGAVLVRAAAHVDPKTAQITAKSDPIPTILEGIPLDVRSVAVDMNRDRFTLNPTNCDPMSLGVDALSSLGQSALLSNRFQVGGCRGLDFEPRFSIRLKGGTRRGANPKLIATVKAKEGEANIARASVKLPRSAFLDQAHIRTVCTRVQFAAEACPAGSVYGKASATTPLLDEPLTGNVYLRSSNNKLPDLVVDLRGPASLPIRIELAGRTDSLRGALRNTFDLVPDAPVSKFRLELLGGKRGLVVNSTDICSRAFRATVKLRAHSGAAHEARPVVRSECGTRGKKRQAGPGA